MVDKMMQMALFSCQKYMYFYQLENEIFNIEFPKS